MRSQPPSLSSRPQRRPSGVMSSPWASRMRTGSRTKPVTRWRVGSRKATAPSRLRRGCSLDASRQRQVFSPCRFATARKASVLAPSTTIVSVPNSVSRVTPWAWRRHSAPPTSWLATDTDTPQWETVYPWSLILTPTPVAGVRSIGAPAFSGPRASSRKPGTLVSSRPMPASTTTARNTAAAAAIAAAVRTGEEPRRMATGSASAEPVSVGRSGGLGCIVLGRARMRLPGRTHRRGA